MTATEVRSSILTGLNKWWYMKDVISQAVSMSASPVNVKIVGSRRSPLPHNAIFALLRVKANSIIFTRSSVPSSGGNNIRLCENLCLFENFGKKVWLFDINHCVATSSKLNLFHVYCISKQEDGGRPWTTRHRVRTTYQWDVNSLYPTAIHKNAHNIRNNKRKVFIARMLTTLQTLK